MTGFDGHNLPPPTDWQKFERLCRDLWAEIWANANTQANGRSGQPQNGVDVYGIPKGETVYSAVQCKRRGNSVDAGEVTERELREEVAKAQNFQPKIQGAFILATTGARDAKIQEVARKLSAEQGSKGLFSVHVWAWDDIQGEIAKHRSVFEQHFGDLIGAVRALDRERMFEVVGEPGYPSALYTRGTGTNAFSVHVGDPGAFLEPEHRAQIDAVRVLLKKGQATIALEQADALRARVWPAASMLAKAHLDALCIGRAARTVLPIFGVHLRNALMLLPFADAAAKRTIAVWERTRIV